MTRLPLLSKLTSHGDGHDCQSQSVSEALAITMVHTGDPSTIIGCRSQVEKFQMAIQGLSIVKSFKVSKFQLAIVGLSIVKIIKVSKFQSFKWRSRVSQLLKVSTFQSF